MRSSSSVLAASAALIVIGSPAAARSPRVGEEIRYFKSLGRGHRIYPFIVAGSPNDPATSASLRP